MGANAHYTLTIAGQSTSLARLEEEIYAPLRPVHPTVARSEYAGAAKRAFEFAKEVVEPNRVGDVFGGRHLTRDHALSRRRR